MRYNGFIDLHHGKWYDRNYEILDQGIRLKEKNMKKLVALLLVMMMVLGTAACGGKDGGSEVKEPETVGEHLLAAFQENPEGSAQEIADRLLAHEIIPFAGATMPVEPGLLMGFNNADIIGFEEGVMFAPMMGTMPFLGYIFVVEDGGDVDAFIEELKNNADLRWNICTEAEELTVAKEGNVVFFLMSPMEFDDAE